MHKFKIFKGKTATVDYTKFKGYDERLDMYFKQTRNPTLSQIKEDLIAGRYELPEMIRSGQIDNHGCLIVDKMAELRKDF